MLYIPDKLLFIHIPRTAGNAITRTLVKHLILSRDLLVGLEAESKTMLDRHARLVDLQKVIDITSVPIIAVDRAYDDIVASDYALHQFNDEGLPGQWGQSVDLSKSETLEQFERRRWKTWIGKKTPWQYWCCDESNKELGVIKIQFSNVVQFWPVICEMVGLSQNIELPIIDFEKRRR